MSTTKDGDSTTLTDEQDIDGTETKIQDVICFTLEFLALLISGVIYVLAIVYLTYTIVVSLTQTP